MSAAVVDRADVVVGVGVDDQNRPKQAMLQTNRCASAVVGQQLAMAEGGDVTKTMMMWNRSKIRYPKKAPVTMEKKNSLELASRAGQRFNGRFRLGKRR